jgi:hypothetical protein
LGGVKRFGSVEVQFGLSVLCDGGIDLGSGFIRLILQILLPYLCQNSSPCDLVSCPDIASAAVG